MSLQNDLESKKEQENSSKLKKLSIAIIALAILGVLFLPFLILNTSFGYYLGTSKPHEIGDTIGGILSPFIGLVSAILIYITIDQQIEANRKIQTQIDNEIVDKFQKTVFEYILKELEKNEKDVFDTKKEESIIRKSYPELSVSMMDYILFRDSISWEIFNSRKENLEDIPEQFKANSESFFCVFEKNLSLLKFFIENITLPAYKFICIRRFNDMNQLFESDSFTSSTLNLLHSTLPFSGVINRKVFHISEKDLNNVLLYDTYDVEFSKLKELKNGNSVEMNKWEVNTLWRKFKRLHAEYNYLKKGYRQIASIDDENSRKQKKQFTQKWEKLKSQIIDEGFGNQDAIQYLENDLIR